MLRAAYIELLFDAERLAAETHTAAAGGWEAHFNRADYEGDWSGVALRSNSPHRFALYIDRTGRPFRDTAVLAGLPYVRECLSRLPFEVRAARILKLAAGATIHEHRDSGLSIEHEHARFHIPITTNAETDFVVGDVAMRLGPGECWYVNVDLPHRIDNRGATDRIHLVVDATVTGELRERVRAATRRY